jgi:D-alanine--poly(phosphoribitol) ligase subunit 1
MEGHMNIVETVNQTQAPYPKEKTLQEIFQQQVKEDPTAEAAIFKGTSITYQQLNEKSNQLARHLRTKGVTSDTIVAIMVDRSLEMIIGLFAILKAGGAYLPIAPDTPEKRIQHMLKDTEAPILLTTSRKYKQKAQLIINQSSNLHIIDINLENSTLFPSQVSCSSPSPSLDLPIIKGPCSMAYVIYTSGSTGTPKGVSIEHRSLINRLHWMQKNYPLTKDDVILQKTPYVFDVSLWELFWWSQQGAKVCFMIPGFERFPQAIVETIEKNSVTVMHFVPSMLNVFLQYIRGSDDIRRMTSLKRVFVSGEALAPIHVTRFNETLHATNGTQLVNLYGPTEATVDVSYFNCPTQGEVDPVPIGKPIDNTTFFIRNTNEEEKNKPIQPIINHHSKGKEKGELCVSGDCLARGYLNQVELTAEKFVIPANQNKGQRYYKTGDLAQWLPDGNVEFLGRIDFQVKIRGLRIELGEIESTLIKHNAIKNCVVIVKKQSDTIIHLIAYVETNRGFSTEEILPYLKKHLPEYMIPNHFVTLEHLPVTPSGKIDRKSLPEPQL